MSFLTRKSFKSLIVLVVFFFLLVSIKNAYAPPPPPSIPIYTWSAHGNTSYGVNRSSIAAFGYSKANCAHCHEQHSSIGGAEPEPAGAPQEYLLFTNMFGDQNGGFCYGCHDDPGSGSQYQVSMPNQYNYSRIAGGDDSITCPDDVKESFVFINQTCADSRNNCSSTEGSAHCLEDIQDYIKNTASWNFGVERTVNPCSACHNPHRAQQDPHTSTGRFTGLKMVSVVSRPSDHSKDNYAWELWGDDPGERMDDYTSLYQAPCQYPWSDPCTSFEPDGSSTIDGSNMFDSVTFCLDCHGPSAVPGVITSTRLGRQLRTINWGPTGDQHGQDYDTGSGGGGSSRAEPYDYSDFVLSCLDCHEPHGSRNEYLLRQTVNGSQVPVIPDPGFGKFYYFCRACHTLFHDGGMADYTNCYASCHFHGSTNHF